MIEDPVTPARARMLDYIEHYKDLILNLVRSGSGYVAYVPVTHEGKFDCVRPQVPMQSFKAELENCPVDATPVVFVQQFKYTGPDFRQPVYWMFFIQG